MKVLNQEVMNRGPLDLEETVPAERMLLDGAGGGLVAPVRMNIHAEALGDEILVLIKAETRAALECARCLTRFERPLRTSMEFHVPVAGRELETEEETRQSLVLALPVKPLCRPDCRGLCPRCGANLNAGSCGCPPETGDKPFAVLKNLKLD